MKTAPNSAMGPKNFSGLMTPVKKGHAQYKLVLHSNKQSTAEMVVHTPQVKGMGGIPTPHKFTTLAMKSAKDKAGERSVGEITGTSAAITRVHSGQDGQLSRNMNHQSNLTLNIPNLNTMLPRLDELNDSGMTGIGELNLENTTLAQGLHPHKEITEY